MASWGRTDVLFWEWSGLSPGSFYFWVTGTWLQSYWQLWVGPSVVAPRLTFPTPSAVGFTLLAGESVWFSGQGTTGPGTFSGSLALYAV